MRLMMNDVINRLFFQSTAVISLLKAWHIINRLLVQVLGSL